MRYVLSTALLRDTSGAIGAATGRYQSKVDYSMQQHSSYCHIMTQYYRVIAPLLIEHTTVLRPG